MAIYHLSVKTISRSAGRSATAAAAYRASIIIRDDRTGEVHDYRRKSGTLSADILLPAGSDFALRNSATLWNSVEKLETRGNSTVAREFEGALPDALTTDQSRALALEYTKALVKRYGFAAEISIHSPSKEGDRRNKHFHMLTGTRDLKTGKKIRVLDDQKTGPQEVMYCRQLLADMTNAALSKAGHSERIDHRSHKDRGIETAPGYHLGPAATAIERRGGVSDITKRETEKVARLVAEAEAAAAKENEIAQKQIAKIERELEAWKEIAEQSPEELKDTLTQADTEYQKARAELSRFPEKEKAAQPKAQIEAAKKELPKHERRLVDVMTERTGIVKILIDLPIWRIFEAREHEKKKASLDAVITKIKDKIQSLRDIIKSPVKEDLPREQQIVKMRMERAREYIAVIEPVVIGREQDKRAAEARAKADAEAAKRAAERAEVDRKAKVMADAFARADARASGQPLQKPYGYDDPPTDAHAARGGLQKPPGYDELGQARPRARRPKPK